VIQGENLAPIAPDDLRFVIDLGHVCARADGGLGVANLIDREIIARQLAVTVRASLPVITPSWLDANGRLDAHTLLEVFVEFWLGHGEGLLGPSPYHEAAPHLVRMAFLQRAVNGGGRIDRESAIGSKRLDLCEEFRGESFAIEVKTWRDTDKSADPVIEGMKQLDGYLARLGLARGWLLLFDQRKSAAPLPERLRRERLTTASGRQVDLVRL